MAVCRDHGLCYKLTAGLHQPLRHIEGAHGVTAHGFLNVLVAAALAHARRKMPATKIRALLEEETIESVSFGDRRLSWEGFSGTLKQVRDARRNGLTSFGSCSFDEPLAGLRALGWQL
jgi:hypothetical protein